MHHCTSKNILYKHNSHHDPFITCQAISSSDQNTAPISPRGRAQKSLQSRGITGSRAPASLTHFSPVSCLILQPTRWPPCILDPTSTLHPPLCLPAASFPATFPQNICRIFSLFGPLLNSVRASLTTPIKIPQVKGYHEPTPSSTLQSSAQTTQF